jgi:hypothetical protein
VLGGPDRGWCQLAAGRPTTSFQAAKRGVISLSGARTRPPALTWSLGGWFVLVDQAAEDGSTLDLFRWVSAIGWSGWGGWSWSARCGRRRL